MQVQRMMEEDKGMVVASSHYLIGKQNLEKDVLKTNLIYQVHLNFNESFLVGQ